jgi:hypothetical protein
MQTRTWHSDYLLFQEKTMESLIRELKHKNLLNEDDADILTSIDVKLKDIYCGEIHCKKFK